MVARLCFACCIFNSFWLALTKHLRMDANSIPTRPTGSGDSLQFGGLCETLVLFSGVRAQDTNAYLHLFTKALSAPSFSLCENLCVRRKTSLSLGTLGSTEPQCELTEVMVVERAVGFGGPI